MSTALTGCSGNGGGDGTSTEGSGGPANGSDGESAGDGDEMGLFGTAASTGGEKTLIDGSVESNVLSGFEIVDHVGVFTESNGSVIVSARIENVGSETVRLIDRHTQRTVLYGPDGEEVEVIGAMRTDTEGQGVNGLPPGETGIMNFLGPNGYEQADIGRYGIFLDCSDESSREDARSPYCPEV